MSLLVLVIAPPRVPALAAGEGVGMRYPRILRGQHPHPHTRRAYARAADEFLAWCASVGVPSIGAVQTGARRHLDRGWDARDSRRRASNQRLAATRHLLIGLVTGQVVPVNPAASVRGPGTS